MIDPEYEHVCIMARVLVIRNENNWHRIEYQGEKCTSKLRENWTPTYDIDQRNGTNKEKKHREKNWTTTMTLIGRTERKKKTQRKEERGTTMR